MEGQRTYSPSLGELVGGRRFPTKVVDKPPSKAAVPPQRIRLEAAATPSSLDTFSTPAGVPTKRRPFVDVSGDVGRMPVGAGGSRQLGGVGYSVSSSLVGHIRCPLCPLPAGRLPLEGRVERPCALTRGSVASHNGCSILLYGGGRITQLLYLLLRLYPKTAKLSNIWAQAK